MALFDSINMGKVGMGHVIEREAAVMCWNPAGDKDPFPIAFKIKDDNGEIQFIKKLHVSKMESEWENGVYKITYQCAAEIDGRMRNFQLINYVLDAKWEMII